MVTMVMRSGDDDDEGSIDAIGTLSFDDPRPMRSDSIFRIASLTKPIAAVVAMMLVDDGLLALDQPVDEHLPELADRRVLRSLQSRLTDTVPADRAITLGDLLTFRLGFGCIVAPPDTYPIQRAEAELQLHTLGPPWPPTPHDPDQWIAALGTLPLMHQPGQEWMYNTGAQVLGVLLERAAGMPIERLLRTRLFDPLGMMDTGFSVSGEQVQRLTTAYRPDDDTGELQVLDAVEGSSWRGPPAMPNTAGWLVSTMHDFAAFARMMAAGGVHDGVALLSPHSFRSMIADHLTAEQRASASMFLDDHSGWGLGMSVPAADGSTGVPGGFGWSGGTGTTWATDLRAGVTGVLFGQRAMTSPEPADLFDDFWKHVYGAVAQR